MSRKSCAVAKLWLTISGAASQSSSRLLPASVAGAAVSRAGSASNSGTANIGACSNLTVAGAANNYAQTAGTTVTCWNIECAWSARETPASSALAINSASSIACDSRMSFGGGLSS